MSDEDEELEKERQEWQALVEADSLHLLPTEALIASIKYLAEKLLSFERVGYVNDAGDASVDIEDWWPPGRYDSVDLYRMR